MQTNYEFKQQKTSRGEINATAYTTSASALPYRSSMTPRTARVQRSRSSCGNISSDATRFCQNQRTAAGNSYYQLGIMGSTTVSSTSAGGQAPIGEINSARQRDKDELVDLNDKFAQYVEEVRSLEALNRTLQHELDSLRGRSGLGTSNIKEMYEIEISEAKKLIEDTATEADVAERRKQQNRSDLNRLQAIYQKASGPRQSNEKEIEALQRQIADNDAKISLLRRRLADIEDESRIYKSEYQHLTSELNRLNNDIHGEKLLKSSCESERSGAESELACLQQMHEEELAEIRSRNMIDSSEPSNIFKKRLVLEIQEIRRDYESSIGNLLQSLKLRYELLANAPDNVAVKPLTGNNLQLMSRLHEEWLKIRNSNEHTRANNRMTENVISDLQQKLKILLERDRLEQQTFELDMDKLQQRSTKVEHDYQEVTTLNITLDQEITRYRQLLEGQQGLQAYVNRINRPAIAPSFATSVVSGGGSGTRVYTSTVRSNYSSGGSGSSRGPLSGGIGILIDQKDGPSNTYQTLSSSTRRFDAHEDISASYATRQSVTSNYSEREKVVYESVPASRSTITRESSIHQRNQSLDESDEDDDN